MRRVSRSRLIKLEVEIPRVTFLVTPLPSPSPALLIVREYSNVSSRAEPSRSSGIAARERDVDIRSETRRRNPPVCPATVSLRATKIVRLLKHRVFAWLVIIQVGREVTPPSSPLVSPPPR